VQVEVWRLRVTKLDGANTTANPANDPRPGTLLVIGLLVLPLGLGGTVWAIVAARHHDRATAMPTMSPVAMSDVLWR
jgi:hypothetical protein